MAGQGEAALLSSDRKGPVQVIELSSDSESNYDEYLENEDAVDSTEQAASGLLATPTKRKAEEQNDGDADPQDESETPTPKRQKLPMRVKDTGVQAGRRRVEIEIPIPSKTLKSPSPRPAVKEDAGKEVDEAQEAEERETEERATGAPDATTPDSKKAHIHFEDDGQADQFFTPLEAPAKNPLETAAGAMDPPPPAGEALQTEDAPESDSDSDAPPEAISTSVAAAQTLQLAQSAQRAAGE